MEVNEIVSSVADMISALASLFAVKYAANAIKASKEIVFLKDKHKLALAIRDLNNYLLWDHFNFRWKDHQVIQRIILNSQNFVSEELSCSLIELFAKCDEFDREVRSRQNKIDRSEPNVDYSAIEEELGEKYTALLVLVNKCQCDIRLA